MDFYRDESAEAVKPMTASGKAELPKSAATDRVMKCCIGVGMVLFFGMVIDSGHHASTGIPTT